MLHLENAMFKQVLNIISAHVHLVVSIVVVAVAAAVLIAVLRHVMRRTLKYKLPLHVYKLVENTVTYTIVVVAFFTVLGLLGVNLTGLLVAGGVVGLAIGIASQQAVSNLISGLFLVFEQPLRVGDHVIIGDVQGVVVDVGILSTKIRALDGSIIRIPNSRVFDSFITNYGKARVRRVEFKIGVSYESDVNYVLEVLKSMIDQHPYCLANPEPRVFVDSYADSAIIIQIMCWTPREVWFKTRADLLNSIKRVLNEAGVEIPYPQRVVYLREYKSSPSK